MSREGEEKMLRVMGDMAEALWHLNDCLVNIEEELVATREAMVEDLRLLHCVLVNNLQWTDLMLEGCRGCGEVESEGVEEMEARVEGVERVEDDL